MQLSFDDDRSLAQAREQLLAELDDGTTCPCCHQHAQRYRWTLPGSAAGYLIRAYEIGGVTRFVESKQVKRRGEQAMPSICRFWDLLEEENDRRPDGGRSGWWRVTTAGERFVLGGWIPKYAYVYNGRVEWRDGPSVTIADRLGRPFDWNDHMRGQAE